MTVEISEDENGYVLVRHSAFADPGDPHIAFTRAEWDAFLAAVRAPVEKERDQARGRLLVVESDNARLGELLATVEAERDSAWAVVGAVRHALSQFDGEQPREPGAHLAAAMRVVDAARAYRGARYSGAAGLAGDHLVAAVDDFDREAPLDRPESTESQDQASGDQRDTPASENADTATDATGAFPVPPIPAEVYQRTREHDHKEPDDRVACAVETGWVAAWLQAKGFTDVD